MEFERRPEVNWRMSSIKKSDEIECFEIIVVIVDERWTNTKKYYMCIYIYICVYM